MKQTAVEWLANELYKKLTDENNDIILDKIYEQAKELEKQQKNDFAIGFANFVIKQQYTRTYEELIQGKKTLEIKSTTELLEMYKKEKGL